ncbi:MAG: cupin domain-containing protein [Cyclobacteriaceae bacterium]|nr:cupin domain-containing protein [Cyclobacteriaceae bacterium]
MEQLPITIESLHSNGGARTVTRAVFPPGASAVMHYHTQYNESFRVIEGQLILIKSGKEFKLNIGQLSPEIEFTEIHTYKNKSDHEVIVDIILEPGHQGCEDSNLILAALAKENKLGLLSKKYSLFWLAFYDLTNTIPVGLAKTLCSMATFYYGRKRIKRYQRFLLSMVENLRLKKVEEKTVATD